MTFMALSVLALYYVATYNLYLIEHNCQLFNKIESQINKHAIKDSKLVYNIHSSFRSSTVHGILYIVFVYCTSLIYEINKDAQRFPGQVSIMSQVSQVCSGSLVSCMSEGSLVSIMALSLSWYPRCMKVPLSLVLVSQQ